MLCPFCAGGLPTVQHSIVGFVPEALAAGHYRCLAELPDSYRRQLQRALHAYVCANPEEAPAVFAGMGGVGYGDWAPRTWLWVMQERADWPLIFARFVALAETPPPAALLSAAVVKIAEGGGGYSYAVAGYGERAGGRLGAIHELDRLGLWLFSADKLFWRWRGLVNLASDADVLRAVREGLVADSARLTLMAAFAGEPRLLVQLVLVSHGWWRGVPGLEYRYALRAIRHRNLMLTVLSRLGCPLENSLRFAAELGDDGGYDHLCSLGARAAGGEVGAALAWGRQATATRLVQSRSARWPPGALARGLAGGCQALDLVAAGCPVEGDELTQLCCTLGDRRSRCRGLAGELGREMLAHCRDLKRLEQARCRQQPRGDEPLLLARTLLFGRRQYSLPPGIAEVFAALRADFGCRPGCDEDALELLAAMEACHGPGPTPTSIAKAVELLGVPATAGLAAKLAALPPARSGPALALLREWIRHSQGAAGASASS